jgi:energy-coupling factor transport system permease protein
MFDLLYAPLRGEAHRADLLYRLDPRIKLLSVALLLVCLALLSSTKTMLITLGGLHLLCVLSRGTRSRVLPLWRALWPLPASIILLGSLRWQAEPALLAWGPVSVTQQSFWAAVGVAARIVSASVAMSLLLWTTEPGDLAAGLTRLGVPFVVGFGFVMALQYVLTFRRLYQHILEAQQSRGLVIPRANPIRAARTYIPVIVPLLISALRSVDSLTLALVSRGFGAGGKRTSRHVLQIRVWDGLFLLSVCLACAGLVWFDRTTSL